MERDRVYLIILAVIIIGFAGVGLTVFSFFSQPPEVSVAGASISSVNLSAICLTVTLSVNNHYPVAIPVKSLDYAVSYLGSGENRILGEGEQQGMNLNPGVHEITIPLTISNPALVRSLLDVLKGGEIRLQVTGTLNPDLFGIAPPIPFSKEILVPVNLGSILTVLGSLLGS